MRDKLKDVLIEGLGLENEAAEHVFTKVSDWIGDENRGVTCTVHIPEKVAIAKLEGSETLSLSVTESTNVAGSAIIKPNSISYVVKFPLNRIDE